MFHGFDSFCRRGVACSTVFTLFVGHKMSVFHGFDNFGNNILDSGHLRLYSEGDRLAVSKGGF